MLLLYLSIAILHSVALGLNTSNETYPSDDSTSHASLSKSDIIGMIVGPLLLMTIVTGFLLVAYCKKGRSLDPPGMRERIPRQPIHGVMSCQYQGNAPPAPPYNPSPGLILAQQAAQGGSGSPPPYTPRHL